MDQVPLIDFSPFLEGSDSGKQKVARKIAEACGAIGFFAIKGHGVEVATVREGRVVRGVPQGQLDRGILGRDRDAIRVPSSEGDGALGGSPLQPLRAPGIERAGVAQGVALVVRADARDLAVGGVGEFKRGLDRRAELVDLDRGEFDGEADLRILLLDDPAQHHRLLAPLTAPRDLGSGATASDLPRELVDPLDLRGGRPLERPHAKHRAVRGELDLDGFIGFVLGPRDGERGVE